MKMNPTLIRLFAVWLLISSFHAAVQAGPIHEQQLKSRNFPLLLQLSRKNDLKARGLKAPVFLALQERLHRDAALALKECGLAACFAQQLQFTDQEIAAVGDELVKIAGRKQWKELIKLLRSSHVYQLFAADADTGFIRRSWIADAKGINNVLATYIEGRAPIYPKIDAIGFQSDDTAYRSRVAASVKRQLQQKDLAFFSLPLDLAINALVLNKRTEAARYLPLTRGYNLAPARHTSKINWGNYRYSAILVPGLGPEQQDVKLDPGGARRCDSAVVRWRAGLAPFLVVSGGNVHPNQTPYNEAVEMKEYLMKEHGIPEEAIIIDPHARHTTTNLRNTNRLIKWLRIPFDKPVMIVTDASQNKYINGTMKDRVVKELGYLPFGSIKMLSSTESEYLPSLNSMHVNSLDPLDP